MIEIPVTNSKLKAADPIKAIGPKGLGDPSTSTKVLNQTKKISGAEDANPRSVTFAI
jgi:hypothetical protein